MKYVSRLMVNEFKMKQLGYDFMGYKFDKEEQLSFHHLIVPNRAGGLITRDNGSILRRDTSHDYLHKIENIDLDRFLDITSQMIDENIKGYLDIENLKAINEILKSFEREYSGYRTKKGHELIKEKYIRDRIIR